MPASRGPGGRNTELQTVVRAQGQRGRWARSCCGRRGRQTPAARGQDGGGAGARALRELRPGRDPPMGRGGT